MALAIKHSTPEVQPEDGNEEETPLSLLTREYHSCDLLEKEAKKRKEALRGPLFAAMTEQVMGRRKPERQVVTLRHVDLANDFNGDIRAWAGHHHPTWVVTNMVTDGDVWTVTLLENLELSPFDFEVDGYKFGRVLSMVGAEFRAEEYWLWTHSAEAADRFPPATLQALRECVQRRQETTFEFDFEEELAQDIIAETPATMEIFQRFSYQGKPRVSFLPFSRAKAEE